MERICALALVSCLLGTAARKIIDSRLEYATAEIQRVQELSMGLLLNTDPKTIDWDLNEDIEIFKKAEVVSQFNALRERGLLEKGRVFNMRDPAIREQTISIVDLMYFTKDFSALHKVASWLSSRINREQFTYALSVVLVNRADLNVALPPWYEIYPNYFFPKSLLDIMKRDSEKRFGLLDFLIAPKEVYLFNTQPMTTSPNYLTADPSLANMFYNWNLKFPSWMDPSKYGLPDWGKRGEIFFRYHSQLLSTILLAARYNSDAFDPSQLMEWNSLKLMQSLDLTNIEGKPIIVQESDLEYNDTALEVYEEKLTDIITDSRIKVNESYSISLEELGDSMISVVSSLVFNLTDSPNPEYYGNFYEALINFLSSHHSDPEKDGGSAAGYPLAMLKDHSFYTVLVRATSLMSTLDYIYNKLEIKPIEGLHLLSVKADGIVTEYGKFPMDMGRYLAKRGSGVQYIINQLVLTHSPFIVHLELENNATATKQAMVTLYLTDPDDTVINIEIDRFPIRVSPGKHTIDRDIKDSSVFSSEQRITIQCGIPTRLLVPKGSADGVSVPLTAVIRPFSGSLNLDDEERYMRKSSLCGSRKYEDGMVVGSRFGPRVLKEAIRSRAAAKTELLVKHKEHKWSWYLTA